MHSKSSKEVLKFKVFGFKWVGTYKIHCDFTGKAEKNNE
jgi:hypothetical protein